MDDDKSGGAPVPSGVASAYLTEEQRASLDRALELASAPARPQPPPKPHHDHACAPKHGMMHVKPAHGTPGDRKTRMIKHGSDAKKGGAGGKYNWGSMLMDASGEPEAVDEDDPNYDSERDAAASASAASGPGASAGGAAAASAAGEDGAAEEAEEDAAAYQPNNRIVEIVGRLKEEIMAILKEYLESGDVAEAAACIADLQLPMYDFYIVKRAVTLAMDRKDREREAMSCLLSELYGQYITPQQMQKGFVKLLEDLPELMLDVPDADVILGTFVCRAIVDEVLPPSFLTRITPPPNSPLEAMQRRCQTMMELPHHSERILRCWGADSKLTFLSARERIALMLKEFIDSGDLPEVKRQLRALNAPFLHHEVVKQAVLLAAEDMAHRKEPMLKLLTQLCESEDISTIQRYKGFQRVTDQLDDLALDIPNLKASWGTIYSECVARGVISAADHNLLEGAAHGSDQVPRVAAPPAAGGAKEATEEGGPGKTATLAAFKAEASEMLREYYDSSDVEEVARLLQDRNDFGTRHSFVKLAITLALDRPARDRELTSQLLPALVPAPVSYDQAASGVTQLLLSADDLVLDVPQAVHLLTLFLARLVVDEVLPPAFLSRVLGSLRAGSLGVEVVRGAGVMLSGPHAAERVLECWHAGLQDPKQVRSSFQMAIREYLLNLDLPEVVRCLRELHVNFFHHEFVRQALKAAFEWPKKVDHVVGLLKHMSESGEISSTQFTKGFKRVLGDLEDEKLDCPDAGTILAGIIEAGKAGKWLELEDPDA